MSGQNGVMDYKWITGWSTCSAFDVLKSCRKNNDCDCLQDFSHGESFCGGTINNPSTTTTTQQTTTPTTTTSAAPETTTPTPTTNPPTTTTPNTAFGCGLPSYRYDKYCDPENNNSGCDYDGGACCNNYQSFWDLYCKYRNVIPLLRTSLWHVSTYKHML